MRLRLQHGSSTHSHAGMQKRAFAARWRMLRQPQAAVASPCRPWNTHLGTTYTCAWGKRRWKGLMKILCSKACVVKMMYSTGESSSFKRFRHSLQPGSHTVIKVQQLCTATRSMA